MQMLKNQVAAHSSQIRLGVLHHNRTRPKQLGNQSTKNKSQKYAAKVNDLVQTAINQTFSIRL